MNKNILFISFLLIIIGTGSIFAQNENQLKLLETAYVKHSDSKLKLFFDNWSKEVGSNEMDAPDEYVAEAHKVFDAFYQPLNLSAFGDFELYKNHPYFIVQGSLWKIRVTDNILYTQQELDSFFLDYFKKNKTPEELEQYLQKAEEEKSFFKLKPSYYSEWKDAWGYVPVEIRTVDSAITFRPPVSFKDKKTVYLTDEYKRLLDTFLMNFHVPQGEYNIMQTAFPIKKSQRRHKFLSKMALTYYGHWGGYWQYETYPKASTIIFDKNLQRAIVHYRIVYHGGYAVLEKRNGKWEFINAKNIWME